MFMKNKMDDLKKAKLILSGEYLLFSLVFVTLAFLFILKVISIKSYKLWLFPIVTMVGGLWCVIDFVICLFSEKRRKKVALIDKILLLPSGILLISCDTIMIISLIRDPNTTALNNFFRIYLSISLFYLSVVYCFQSIYHYFKPIPALLEAVEADRLMKEQKDEENKNEPDIQ